MTTIHVEIKNLNEIRMAFLRAPQKMARNLQTAIDRSTNRILRESKKIVRQGIGYSRRPFATGHMWREIVPEKGSLQGKVISQADYSIYVHEGLSTSRKYGRRPFMEDAVKETQKDIDNEFKEAVKRSLP